MQVRDGWRQINSGVRRQSRRERQASETWNRCWSQTCPLDADLSDLDSPSDVAISLEW